MLKKIFGFSLVLLASASANVFALSSKARMVLTGDFVEMKQEEGKKPELTFFTLEKKAQKDDDGITIDFSAGNFGGRIGVWYNVDANTGSTGSAISFRRSNVWFKPIEGLKLIAGFVGTDQICKERIDEWKGGNPFSLAERDWVLHPGYVNNADVDDMGFGFDYRPFDGLILTGGIARRHSDPGNIDAPFATFGNGDPVFNCWGLTARYYWNNFCFQGGYRDDGSQSWKALKVAVSYEGHGFYGFFMPVFGIDYVTAKSKYELTGICFDTYGEYRFGSWTFMGHLPVTVRLTKAENDPNYMEADFVVKYNFGKIGNMEDFSPTLRFGNLVTDGDNKYSLIRLNKEMADHLNIDINAGVSFAVGGCKFSTGAEFIVYSPKYAYDLDLERFAFKMPFKAEIRF